MKKTTIFILALIVLLLCMASCAVEVPIVDTLPNTESGSVQSNT